MAFCWHQGKCSTWCLFQFLRGRCNFPEKLNDPLACGKVGQSASPVEKKTIKIFSLLKKKIIDIIEKLRHLKITDVMENLTINSYQFHWPLKRLILWAVVERSNQKQKNHIISNALRILTNLYKHNNYRSHLAGWHTYDVNQFVYLPLLIFRLKVNMQVRTFKKTSAEKVLWNEAARFGTIKLQKEIPHLFSHWNIGQTSCYSGVSNCN